MVFVACVPLLLLILPYCMDNKLSMNKLNDLYNKKIITEEEYENKKLEIMNRE